MWRVAVAKSSELVGAAIIISATGYCQVCTFTYLGVYLVEADLRNR